MGYGDVLRDGRLPRGTDREMEVRCAPFASTERPSRLPPAPQAIAPLTVSAARDNGDGTNGRAAVDAACGRAEYFLARRNEHLGIRGPVPETPYL